jgi:antitoxin PrlF
MKKQAIQSVLTKKAQFTLPKRIRERLGLKPGDRIAFILEKESVRLVPVHSTLDKHFACISPKQRPEDYSRLRKEVESLIADEVVKEQD